MQIAICIRRPVLEPRHEHQVDGRAEDGERLALIEFESEAHSRAWRDHPEHRKAQQEGRDSYYSEYSLQICEVVRESRFERSER